jgi:hypothetical protein
MLIANPGEGRLALTADIEVSCFDFDRFLKWRQRSPDFVVALE